MFSILYNSVDSYVYLIPMFISFAIWIGLGICRLAHRLSQNGLIGLGIGLLLIAYFLVHSMSYAKQVDASHDFRAEGFSREILSAAPENAILFAKGDQAVFALWYFHFALKERSDLAVIATDLLHFDWYQENLKSTYPSLILPDFFPWPGTVAAVNPARPACYVQYDERTEMECIKP